MVNKKTEISYFSVRHFEKPKFPCNFVNWNFIKMMNNGNSNKKESNKSQNKNESRFGKRQD